MNRIFWQKAKDNVNLWVIPGQANRVFRTRLKNIFFHEKPQKYTILRYLNLFFNTFCVLGAFFLFLKF